MHYSAHYAGHAQKGIVLFGYIHSQLVDVPHARKDKPAYTSEEKTGSKDTAATTAAVRCRRGKDLEQYYQPEIYEQHVLIAVKHGVVHYSLPILH